MAPRRAPQVSVIDITNPPTDSNSDETRGHRRGSDRCCGAQLCQDGVGRKHNSDNDNCAEKFCTTTDGLPSLATENGFFPKHADGTGGLRLVPRQATTPSVTLGDYLSQDCRQDLAPA